MSCCKGKQTFPDGVTTAVNNCRTGTEMPDGYFLKRWRWLWKIAPDSQQLTNTHRSPTYHITAPDCLPLYTFIT